MANHTTKYTVAVNKEFKGRMLRGQVSVVGSFFAFRVEDPEGATSLKTFQEAAHFVGEMLAKDGLVKDFRPESMSYWSGGCVSNWSRHF